MDTLNEKILQEFHKEFSEYILKAYPNKTGLYSHLLIWIEEKIDEVAHFEREKNMIEGAKVALWEFERVAKMEGEETGLFAEKIRKAINSVIKFEY